MTRQPEAVDLVAGADFLYPMGNTGEIVTYGEVAVRGDTITYAGARNEAGSWAAKREISGCGKAVLPGFVNCQSHTASILFRSHSDDDVGGRALYHVAFVGTLDMIKSGVTNINDIW